MEAAPAAIPPNPKIAATTAIIRNVIVQRNMVINLLYGLKKRCHVLITPLPLCLGIGGTEFLK